MKTKKNPENSQRETQFSYRRTAIRIQQISHLEPWKLKGRGTAFFQVLKSLSTENSVPEENIFQESGGSQDILK